MRDETKCTSLKKKPTHYLVQCLISGCPFSYQYTAWIGNLWGFICVIDMDGEYFRDGGQFPVACGDG